MSDEKPACPVCFKAVEGDATPGAMHHNCKILDELINAQPEVACAILSRMQGTQWQRIVDAMEDAQYQWQQCHNDKAAAEAELMEYKLKYSRAERQRLSLNTKYRIEKYRAKSMEMLAAELVEEGHADLALDYDEQI